MKTSFIFLLTLASFGLLRANPPIDISIIDIRDRIAIQQRVEQTIEAYVNQLVVIRNGLREAGATSEGSRKELIFTSISELDNLLERRDASAVAGLLPLVDLLHLNNSDESEQIIPTVENGPAKGVINYLIDGIFTARMMGVVDAVGDQEMEAMIRFYAGNPAQTSEGSWQTNNTMLFVFGDRVLNTLAMKAPDRIDAFYKAVLDGRKSAESGLGPDEEAIPDADRPTAEQLRAYEATFVRLEALVATGTLPQAEPSSQIAPTHTLPLPQAVPAVQPLPKQSATSKPSPTRSEDSNLSTPGSIIVVMIVVAIGLLWLLLKKRK